MNIKRIIIPLLLIIFMASMAAFGAPVYVNVGPTTEFDGDIKILSEIVAEGVTPDDWETTIFFTDPTADRTITVPDFDVTLGTAILLTVTDNENTNETNAVLFTSGGELAGGVFGIESDGDYYYNPSDGSVHATMFYGDGSNLTGVGAAAATALTFTAKEENTSAIVKGQPVYISGAAGAAFPTIGLTDCDDSTKIRIVGLAAEAITQNTNGLVRRAGLLVGVDTLGANAVNPNGEAWAAGDILYVDDTVGGLTNVKPTSGRIIKAAYTLYGSSNTDDLLVITHENPVYIACAPGEDIDLRMGDEAGVNKVIFEDYADNEVAFIDSNGQADFNSLILDNPLLPAEGGTGVANNVASTLTISGNFATTLTVTEATGVTLPASGTLYGTKADSITSAQLLSSVTNETGTGVLVFATSPTLVTPTLGVATATSYSGVLAANLVDKSATEAISGAWTFSNTMTIANNADASFDALLLDSGSTATQNVKIQFLDQGVVKWHLLKNVDNNIGLYSITYGGYVATFSVLGRLGINTDSPSGTLDINIATDADAHILLSENSATKWDIYNDHNDDNLQILSGATLRYEFGTDGTANADVAWGTFSPVVEGEGEELLAIALEDANKPVKPYEGIPVVKTDDELFDMIPTEYEEEVNKVDDEGNPVLDIDGKPIKEIVTKVKDEKVFRERRPNEFATEAEKLIEYDKYHKVPAKITIANAKYLEYLTGVIDAMQVEIDLLKSQSNPIVEPIK